MALIGLAILIFVLAVSLIHLIAYAIRWVEEGRANNDKRTITETPFSLILSILLEILCAIAVLILSAVDFLIHLRDYRWRPRTPVRPGSSSPETEPPPPPRYGGPRPVVLVHGAGMRGLGMYPLARMLRRRGRPAHLFTYWPPGQHIGAYGRQLREYLDALRRKHGYTEFDAIGHSLGGLVIRRYLAVHPEGIPIRRFVTIGTPHGGSELWRFLPSTTGRQLRPGGEFLRHLDEGRLPAGVQATAISSDFDQLVVPNLLARWEVEGVSNFTVANAGHARLIFHPETHRIVLEALA